MMCQMIGLPPISIIGLGLRTDSSLIRVPSPPAKITHFICLSGEKRRVFRQKVATNASGTPEGLMSGLEKPAELSLKSLVGV